MSRAMPSARACRCLGTRAAFASRPYGRHPYRERRFNSFSTASRMKSERFSPSRQAASIRASVPAGKRAGVCSSLIFGRPTLAGLSDITFFAKPCILLISPIDRQSDIAYVDDIRNEGKISNQRSGQSRPSRKEAAMIVKFSTLAGGVFIEDTGADERKPSDRCFRFDERGNAEYALFADLIGSNPAPRWWGHQFTASQFEFA